MEHFELKIKDFNPIAIPNAGGRVIALNEFHVPKGFMANDFYIEVVVKYGDGISRIYGAKLSKTKDSHIADLANNMSEKVSSITIQIQKPTQIQEMKLPMSIRYQLQ